jgi:osmotically-inducible protein OsmY
VADATSATTNTRASADTTGAATTSADVSARITEWRLSATEIQSDLDSGVTIVRTKESIVGAPTGRMDDEMLEKSVTEKLQADSEVSKAMIDVEAKDGEVTLKGTVESADHVGRAIALALDSEGVNKVSSEIKVSAADNK